MPLTKLNSFLKQYQYYLLASLVVPLSLLLFFKPSASLRGPYYAYGNFDPDYAYLFNSLNVLNGIVPWHRDHPGTTVQSFGALVLKAKNPQKNSTAITVDVLKNPERYLRQISFGLLILVGLLLFTAQLLIGLKTEQPLLGLSFGLFLFLWTEPWYFLQRFTPDLLIMALSSLFCATLFFISQKSNQSKGFVILGVLYAAMLATKLTGIFLVLLTLPWVLTNRHNLFSAAKGWVFSVFIFILPLFFSFKESAAYILAVPKRIFFATPPSTDSWWHSKTQAVLTILHNHPIIAFSVGLGLGFYLLLRLTSKLKKFSEAKLLAALLGLIVFQIFFVAGKSNPARYWLALYPVIGLVLVLFLDFCFFNRSGLSKLNAAKPLARAYSNPFPFFLSLVSLLAVIYFTQPMRIFVTENKDELKAWDLERINFAIDSNKCLVVFGDPSFTQEFGLLFGNHFANSHYSKLLAEIYPQVYFWGQNSTYWSFNDQRMSLAQLQELTNHQKLCLRASSKSPPTANDDGQFTLIQQTKENDWVYLISAKE